MDWTAVGVIVTGLGLIVTILLFGIESRRARRAAVEANRRALVGRVIVSVEKAARAHSRFPFGHVLNNAEFEFAVALPRLLVELNPDEQPVALWVGKQMELMQGAPRAKDATRIAYAVAFKLADWHSGRTSIAWFSEQVRLSPINPSFRAPLLTTLSRRLRFSLEVAKVTVVIASLVLAFRSLLRRSEAQEAVSLDS